MARSNTNPGTANWRRNDSGENAWMPVRACRSINWPYKADPFGESGSRIGAHLDGHLAQSSPGVVLVMLVPNRTGLAQIDGEVRLKGKHPVETSLQDLFIVLSERVRHQHYADQAAAQGVHIPPECIPIRAAEERIRAHGVTIGGSRKAPLQQPSTR